jgi:hypothetical protein
VKASPLPKLNSTVFFSLVFSNLPILSRYFFVKRNKFFLFLSHVNLFWSMRYDASTGQDRRDHARSTSSLKGRISSRFRERDHRLLRTRLRSSPRRRPQIEMSSPCPARVIYRGSLRSRAGAGSTRSPLTRDRELETASTGTSPRVPLPRPHPSSTWTGLSRERKANAA